MCTEKYWVSVGLVAVLKILITEQQEWALINRVLLHVFLDSLSSFVKCIQMKGECSFTKLLLVQIYTYS